MDFIDLLLDAFGIYKALWISIYIIGLGIIATIFTLIHFSKID